MTSVLQQVACKVQSKGKPVKTIILPHCTWEKFGDLLSIGGGRALGLFDEIMSFFSAMNMYSSVTMQISDKHNNRFLLVNHLPLSIMAVHAQYLNTVPLTHTELHSPFSDSHSHSLPHQ